MAYGNMIVKKTLSMLLILCLTIAVFPVGTAEEYDNETEDRALEDTLVDDDTGTAEDAENAEGEDTENVVIVGHVYQEKTKEDFTLKSPAIYTAQVGGKWDTYSIFEEKSIKSKKLVKGLKYTTVDILYVGLTWVIVRYNNVIGYVKREYIIKESVKPLDPVNTPPFNVQKHTYIATVAKPCYVRKSMTKEPLVEDELSTYWVKLNPGTRISIWQFQEGWAIVNYMRNYGYIDPDDLTDLIPVSPTDVPLSKDTPIAAYTSYYTMKHLDPRTSAEATKMNINRIENIRIGCERLTQTMQPGDVFDANSKDIGPYRYYRAAYGLVNGKSVKSRGGGTCQVASTLYNIIIQLPGMKILYRRPHGADGASYLPIHCDAAVGTESLNFKFRNDYDFPIRIEGHTSGDGALLMVAYRAD